MIVDERNILIYLLNLVNKYPTINMILLNQLKIVFFK